MTLEEVQTNLLSIIQGVTSLSAVMSRIFIDDGTRAHDMEAGLNTDGITILIMHPDDIGYFDHARGAVSLLCGSRVVLRTNPKVKVDGSPRWNPRTLQTDIISAVLTFSKSRTDFGYSVEHGGSVLLDDIGNYSVQMVFAAKVDFRSA